MLNCYAISIPCQVHDELSGGLMIRPRAMRDDSVLKVALQNEQLRNKHWLPMHASRRLTALST